MKCARIIKGEDALALSPPHYHNGNKTALSITKLLSPLIADAFSTTSNN